MPIVMSEEALQLAMQIAAEEGRGLSVFELRNIECGLHSGIPPCCVAFFDLHWKVRWTSWITNCAFILCRLRKWPA